MPLLLKETLAVRRSTKYEKPKTEWKVPLLDWVSSATKKHVTSPAGT